jgi:hypothetical protein
MRWVSSGDTIATGVEVKGVAWLNGDGVARFKTGMNICQGDDVVAVEFEMQPCLITQTFNTGYNCGLTFGEHKMFWPQAN